MSIMLTVLKPIKILVLLLIVYTPVSYGQSLQNLRIMTEDYPPFNFSEHGQAAGQSVELLLKASAAVGQPIFVHDISIAIWARSYQMTLNGPNVMLFSTVRNTERESSFKWAGPIGVNRMVIWSKKTSNINQVDDLTTLRDRVLVIRDSIDHQQMIAHNVPERKLVRMSNPSAAAKMLAKGREKLWVYNEATAIEILKRIGEDLNDYKIVHVLESSDLYFAFSNDVDDSVVALLQKGIDLVKK